MPATLRLMRLGKKRSPFYRVIAVDRRKKRNTRYIENIGVYDPMAETSALQIDKKKFDKWVENGAIISEGLTRLLKNKKRVQFKA